MEFVFNRNRGRHFLSNLFRDREDGSLSLGNSSFGAPEGNRSVACSLVRAFFNVNLGTSRVFDLVDGCPAASKDAGDRSSGDSELNNVV